MKKKLGWAVIYLVAVVAFAELSVRIYWHLASRTPVFGRLETIAYLVFYPELRAFERLQPRDSRERPGRNFDVLILGASVMNSAWGNIERALSEELEFRLRRKVRVLNLAVPAQSSRDSYLKFEHLSGTHFDLVVFYDSINEARENNCPQSVFRNDYSHHSWYLQVNELEHLESFHSSVLLFTFNYLANEIHIRRNEDVLIPNHELVRKEWLEYGADVKTENSYRENVAAIVRLAKENQEKLVLMTFSYYLPKDYSKERFDRRELDYKLHRSPVEIWGEPANVVAAIEVHNSVIRDLAAKDSEIIFIDQKERMPTGSVHFNDICHLTQQGSEVFVRNMIDSVVEKVMPTDRTNPHR